MGSCWRIGCSRGEGKGREGEGWREVPGGQ